MAVKVVKAKIYRIWLVASDDNYCDIVKKEEFIERLHDEIVNVENWEWIDYDGEYSSYEDRDMEEIESDILAKLEKGERIEIDFVSWDERDWKRYSVEEVFVEIEE